MDTVKIGKYIAGKRKALGMTQAQVAEKLGMSDKSVSKWERGICLPDVSVYMALCEILGISLNEFIAGEDIEPAEVLQKSDPGDGGWRTPQAQIEKNHCVAGSFRKRDGGDSDLSVDV